MHHSAKFCADRWNRCRDMAVFRFVQDGGRPPSWIFKSTKFELPVQFGLSICVTMPNIVQIGQTVKSIFQDGGRPPSWIFNSLKF